MSHFTTSSTSSSSNHTPPVSRSTPIDADAKSYSARSGQYHRDDESVSSDMSESPTLPPERSRGEDVTEIGKVTPEQPVSPRHVPIAATTSMRGNMYNNVSSVAMMSSYSHSQTMSLSSSVSHPHISSNGSMTQPMERARSAQSVPQSTPNSSSHHHQSSRSSSQKQHLRHTTSQSVLQPRRSKRSIYMSDHAAAAIELSASPQVPPSPAAGMYWSRSVTYGRGPSRPLRAHTVNLIGEQLFVFGGCDIKTCFNSLYILDMDTMTWSKPRTSGQPPPPCRAHSSTLVERDLGSGKRAHYLYIFGGGDGPNYFNDLYVLHTDTLTWSKPATEGIPPSPRRAHTTCLWNDKIVVVGGGDGARALADVHMLDISDMNRPRWIQVKPTGIPPIARGYHTSNLVRDKLIVYGGSDGHECFGDVHVLDLVTNHWTQVELDRVVPRLAHSATQVGSYVFVVGGHDGTRYSNDLLLLNLVTMSWESRRIYGSPPTPRGYHTAVLHDSRLYILGGYDGKTVFDDVYMLELSACAYLPQITNFEIDL